MSSAAPPGIPVAACGRVRVLLFARLREIAGWATSEVPVAGDGSVDALWSMLVERHPGLAGERASLRVARNGVVVAFDCSVSDGDELAFLPPVGGG